MNFIILTLLSMFLSCSHQLKEGDRHLKKNERPEFLKQYESYEDVKFYEKIKKDVRTFEVKYEDKADHEISLTFDEEGKLLEREEDLEYSALPLEIRKKITQYVEANYPQALIHETEKRTDKEGNRFFDIEIRHSSSESGYWELSFDEAGNYVSREKEKYDPINTLN